MKIKTNQLTGAALDWAVAKCEGRRVELNHQYTEETKFDGWWQLGPNHWQPLNKYSTDWAQGGPIIERERIELKCWDGTWGVEEGTWVAEVLHEDRRYGGLMRSEGQGPTILLAAMRCYAASRFGGEVDVPDELLK
jgi:hypothetical protein